MAADFVTAINCMDGRAQKPVIDYLTAKFGARYVDMITEPGVNRILAEQDPPELVCSIIRRVAISVDKHGSRVVAVAGHHDCAGNPVDAAAQQDHLSRAVDAIRAWDFELDPVIGLWLDENFNISWTTNGERK